MECINSSFMNLLFRFKNIYKTTLKKLLINMSFTIDQVTAKTNSLILQGDNKYNQKNFQDACNYYTEAYNIKILYYTINHPSNSGLYLRMAMTLYEIGDSKLRIDIPNLKKAKIYAKLYLKIKQFQNKSAKRLDILNLILGNYYKKVHKHDKAIQCFIVYKNIIEKSLNSNNLDQFLNYFNLGNLLLKYNKTGITIEIFEKILGIIKNKIITNYDILGIVYFQLGTANSQINNFEKSSDYYNKLINLYENKLLTDFFKVAECYCSLGLLYLRMKLYEKALEIYVKCSKMIEDPEFKDQDKYGVILKKIAEFYISIKDKNKALEYIEKWKSKWENMPFKPDDISQATYFSNQGYMLMKMNDFEEALKLIKISKSIYKKQENFKYLNISYIYSYLCELYSKMGKKEKFYASLEKSIKMLESISPNHKELEISYNTIIYMTQIKPDNIKKIFEYCQKLKDLEIKNPNLESLINTYTYLGHLHYLCNENNKVIEYYKKIKCLLKNISVSNYPSKLNAYFNLGTLCMIININKALKFLENAVKIIEANPENIKPKYWLTYMHLGKLNLKINKNNKAIEFFKKFEDFKKSAIGLNIEMTAINYFFLGLAYKNSYQKREALEIFEKCRSILEKHPNLDSDMLRLVFFQLGDIYLNSVEYAKALDFYNKGLDIKEKSYFFYELCEIVEAYIKIGTSLKNMNQKGTFARI